MPELEKWRVCEIKAECGTLGERKGAAEESGEEEGGNNRTKQEVPSRIHHSGC